MLPCYGPGMENWDLLGICLSISLITNLHSIVVRLATTTWLHLSLLIPLKADIAEKKCAVKFQVI